MELHVCRMELCVLQVLTGMARLVSVTINAHQVSIGMELVAFHRPQLVLQVSIGMEHAVFHRHPPVHQVSNGMGQPV